MSCTCAAVKGPWELRLSLGHVNRFHNSVLSSLQGPKRKAMAQELHAAAAAATGTPPAGRIVSTALLQHTTLPYPRIALIQFCFQRTHMHSSLNRDCTQFCLCQVKTNGNDRSLTILAFFGAGAGPGECWGGQASCWQKEAGRSRAAHGGSH